MSASARELGTVLIGNQTVARSDIRRLPECALPQTDADWSEARASLERDGFVLIRGAFDAATIAKCRATMLAQVQRRGGIDVASARELGDPSLCACAPIARTADGKKLQAGWTTDALVCAICILPQDKMTNHCVTQYDALVYVDSVRCCNFAFSICFLAIWS